MGVIILKQAGQDIPQEYLEKAHTANPMAVGMARVSGNEIFTGYINDPMPLDQLQQVLEQFKDEKVLLCLSELTPSTNSLQPFMMCKNDEGEIQFVVAMEGDFSEFAKAGSSDTDAFHAFVSHLLPKFNGIFTMRQGSVTEIVGELQNPMISREIGGLATSGHTMIMCANGFARAYGKGGSVEALSTPFGWVSDKFGMFEGAQKLAEPAKETVKSVAAGFLAQMGFGGKKEEPKKLPEGGTPLNLKKEETSTAVKLPTKFAPPADIVAEQDLKAWYRRNEKNGNCPKDWRERVAVEVKPRMLKSFQDAFSNKTVASTEPVKQPDVPITPAVVEPPAKEGVSDEVLPIIPPKEAEAVRSQFLKTMSNGKEPSTLHEKETKFPSYAETMGLKGGLDDTMGYSYQALLDLCNKFPNAAARLMFDYKRAYYQLSKSKPTQGTQQTAKPAEQPQQKKAVGGSGFGY